MQVFAKVNDKGIITLEVTADNTVQELAAKALKKQYPERPVPPNDQIRVVYQSRTLNLDLQLREYNLKEETTFQIMLLPSKGMLIDHDVTAGLQRFLYVAATEANENEITFIGVGSYDNGHGSLASVKRQQCPDTLLAHCIENHVDLNIILIDPGFQTESQYPPQVYHSGHWALMHNDMGGKIRQYKYQPAVAMGACDIWLTTFATIIAEYSNDLKNQGTVIATVDLPIAFAAVAHMSGACLICGNFYGSPTDESQFFTLGDEQTIMSTGFMVNPPR
ncbi:ubiquitin-like protein [Metapseudomonas otitidis]|uniref:ubiquitin-like protein n=1 Tax=Metapseudomonas otitidis TaxID=319939 RepID=UPI0013F5C651|nr:ubiquitin-like protein [Pseudomonas otitidis]